MGFIAIFAGREGEKSTLLVKIFKSNVNTPENIKNMLSANNIFEGSNESLGM